MKLCLYSFAHVFSVNVCSSMPKLFVYTDFQRHNLIKYLFQKSQESNSKEIKSKKKQPNNQASFSLIYDSIL